MTKAKLLNMVRMRVREGAGEREHTFLRAHS